jgi:hypothetical protein
MLVRAVVIIVAILFVAWLVGGLIRDRTRKRR